MSDTAMAVRTVGGATAAPEPTVRAGAPGTVRRAARGEHVDDHQEEVAGFVDAAGLALCREVDVLELADLDIARTQDRAGNEHDRTWSKAMTTGALGLPAISVIMPFFNCGPELAAATEALSRLDYPQLQLILVDDGSSDASSVIAQSFVQETPGARLVTNPVNLGVAEARNRALKVATGDYVWFTDWDDEWSPSILMHLGRAVARTNADVAICRAVRVDERGQVIEIAEDFQGGRELTGPETVDEMIRETIKGFLWTKLIRRSLIPEDPFPRLDSLSDFCGLAPVLARADTVTLLDDVLYRYVRRDGSISHKRSRVLSDFDHHRQTMRELAPAHYGQGRRGSVDALRFDYVWQLMKARASVFLPDRTDARKSLRAIAREIEFSDLREFGREYPVLASKALAVKLLGRFYPDVFLAARWVGRRVVAPARVATTAQVQEGG